MTANRTEMLLELAEYKGLFEIFALFFFAICASVILYTCYEKYVKNRQRAKTAVTATKQDLRNLDYNKVKKSRKGEILREMIAPDGIDPGPCSYLIINDGGVDVYEQIGRASCRERV